MNEEKLLTISIAAYNVEKYIGKTIASCLSEATNSFVEILVIDDGSTDKTAQIASKYEKNFPDVVHVIRKQNGGYGSTINTAIPLAHGKYFKLLDGDDWFDKDGFYKFITLLKRIDTDMILTPYMSVSNQNGKKQLNCDIHGIKSDEYPIDMCLKYLKYIPMHSVAFKTQLLRISNIRLPEHCFYTDVEFVFTAISSVKNVFILHNPVYCYRIGRNEQSMSILGIRKHFADHGIVLKRLFNKYDDLSDKETGAAKVMYLILKKECYGHYRYNCLLQINYKNKMRLITYDKKLKNRSQLYNQLEKESKMIFVLRKTGFWVYPIICLWERMKKEY